MSAAETTEITERLIDIEALFAAKNPRLLKFIPGFILSYLKRIVHQDEVNGYIWRNRDKTGLPFVDAILSEFGVNTRVLDGRAPLPQPCDPLIPASGRYIVASNHPLGGLDGMALMQVLGKARRDIIFPVNDLLMNVPGLRPLFIPINKHGRNTENARLIDQTFASEKMILYFPAGLVSRKMRGSGYQSSVIRHPSSIIRDLEWKSTFIKKAKKYHRDIIPVYIAGRNSEWFYNLSNWRKRLGIRANIEMLYLVDEMARQLGKTITLVIGDPIHHATFDKSRSETQWAEYVKEKVYDMEKLLNIPPPDGHGEEVAVKP
ncbi:MAG: 1-acyl-sn-glycerol-3-phosphate acyltransferase [Bacteroidota bacterium]